jgi:hypothetical protein
MLMAGNIGISILGPGDPLGFEDIEEGRSSQREIAALRFDAAVFGHGRTIRSGASDRVGRKWGSVMRHGKQSVQDVACSPAAIDQQERG